MAPPASTDGRSSKLARKKGSDTGRTVRFRAVGAQRGALTPHVPAMAPTSVGWPIWPAIDHARPCECHATIAHATAAAVGVCWHHPRPERLRLTPFHWCCRTCDSATHYWDFSSSRRELALGADGGCLVLSWNHSKKTSCLSARLTYRPTHHHAAASLAFEFASAPLGVTRDASATRPATSTTAPPCPSRTRRARGTGRAIAHEGVFESRVVVVVSSSVVHLGSPGTT